MKLRYVYDDISVSRLYNRLKNITVGQLIEK